MVLQRGAAHGETTDAQGTRVLCWTSQHDIGPLIDRQTEALPRLILYSDFYCMPKQVLHPCLLLQHGIYWDNLGDRPPANWLAMIERRRLLRRTLRKIERCMAQVDYTICVNTNFSNWLQTAFPWRDWQSRIEYIPNFAGIPEASRIPPRPVTPGKIRCLFPRRFSVYRGTLVFAGIVARLAPAYPQVTFAFAGDGDCTEQVHALRDTVPGVEMYRRAAEEMPEEYLRADIVVIPTLRTEGTSLACVEAMAAGCAVVATRVGGLCNLIIPDYNGLLCQPTESIEQGLSYLLDHPAEIDRLGQRAPAKRDRCLLLARAMGTRVLGVIRGVCSEQ